MVSQAKKNRHLSSNHLFLPPVIKDFASCFSEHAVKVSDTSCSGSSSSGNSSVIDHTASSSVVSSVTCLYRTRLSTQRELLIRVTWSKAQLNPLLSVAIVDGSSTSPWEANCHLLRKKNGSRTYISEGNCEVGLHWDISSANFEAGPEPRYGFYVAVVVDSEFALLLGDLSEEFAKRFDEATLPAAAECSMFSRREQVVGDSATHTTRARFREGGEEHEITIRCKGEGWNARESELAVTVDKKRVVHARSLRWNFRGNQTIFIEGSPVDMMWDVHDWWFGGGSAAVFMFRARSTFESRLWLEEETLQQEGGAAGFSLLIQAFKAT
ncbi:uncharacterized protein LOC122011011 [Zingiber officinale]|uniref:DUF868 family protein n=1 Tax=Zingiber officinale TaxID=94328 RepID=A0A8J5FLB6_ZINOF|nr:uncharacterized protein LOC122011011 [Zingiber officinale]KAG6487373.1 hypothetical protein ZIOFF_055959 [Zingiber officinale]